MVIPEGGDIERKIPGNPQWLDQSLLNRPIERQTVILEIERVISQYELDGAIVRFEEYPRMDVLVEVEGGPDAICAAAA